MLRIIIKLLNMSDRARSRYHELKGLDMSLERLNQLVNPEPANRLLIFGVRGNCTLEWIVVLALCFMVA